MRIAWLGPADCTSGGVPLLGYCMLDALSKQPEVEIDIYAVEGSTNLPEGLLGRPNVRLMKLPNAWRWGRWYSRTPFSAMLSNLVSRWFGYRMLLRIVATEHAAKSYDVLYQFSQIENFFANSRLPPLVLHPEVHAAGEFRWHRRESHYARMSESLFKHFLARIMLLSRTVLQPVYLSHAARIIAPSQHFADLLHEDGHVPRQKIGVVPNMLTVQPQPLNSFDVRDREYVIFVSRLSVRKGVEMIIGLADALADHEVDVRVVGGPSLWSDYSKHLVNSRAKLLGSLSHSSVMGQIAGATALVLPSHYEPFGLVVSEALALGTPVVVSSEVGAAEGLDRRVCRTFADGDSAAFLATIQDLRKEMALDETALRTLATSEARRLFRPDVICAAIVSQLSAIRGSQ